jgi:lipoprotein-anchoring transpeptidase ErfK/SrfK
MNSDDGSKKDKMWIGHSVKIEPVDDTIDMASIPEEDVTKSQSIYPIASDDSSQSQTKKTDEKQSTPKVQHKLSAFLVKHRIAFTVFAVVFGTGWILCSVFLSQIKIGNTEIASQTSEKNFAFKLSEQVDTYKLSVKYPDGKTKQYPLEQVGISVDEKATISATMQEKNKIQRRLIWWNPIETKFVFKNDSNKLRAFIANEVDVSVQPYKDATLKIENGKIMMTDSENGIRYRLKEPEKVLTKAVTNLQTDPILLEKLTEDPKLTAELLKPYKDTLEKTLNQPIVFVIGDKKVSPDSNQVASWLDVTPDTENKKMKITVNSGKVEEYINTIARSAIRPAKNELIVDKPDGTSQVISTGVRGIDIKNKGNVSTTIANTLLDGKGVYVELPVEYQSFKTVRTGYYPKWIQADITNKRLYAHEYGETVKTILISAGAPATPTVTGEFTIGAKLVSQDMRGRNVDGSNYFQPRVPWVSYFYKDYAIHGNYWRPTSYFGNINSSHGCIGMINSDAQWIYNWAPAGTPVIVYK